ncbi:MAG: hypothetical protein HYR84_06805 [Planctomycetes bacterium]|nr:hypothetical protein [Planctomycetota bacterium]
MNPPPAPVPAVENAVQPLVAPADVRDENRLRQQHDFQGLIVKQLGRRVRLPEVKQACVVREYAHQHKAGDDAPTVCWFPVVVLRDGKADVKFDLTSTGTRYHVLVHCHTFDGQLGTQRAVIVVDPSRSAPATQPLNTK